MESITPTIPSSTASSNSTLSSLPPEILCLITELLFSQDLHTLWCTLDLSLHRKLAHGGATRLELTTHTFGASNFPAEFRQLRHLTLTADPTIDILQMRRRLASLPCTIESCTFKFSLAHKMLFQNEHDSFQLFAAFPRLTSLTVDEDIIELTVEEIKSLPPQLTRFQTGFGTHLNDEMIAHLPRGLLHLEFNPTQILTPSSAQALPPSLTHLSLVSERTIRPAVAPLLPRTLTHLSAVFVSLSVPDLQALPPMLKEISLGGAMQAKLVPGDVSRLFSSSFTSLTSLTLTMVVANHQDLNSLPRTLKVLKFNKGHTPIPIGDLPTTIPESLANADYDSESLGFDRAISMLHKMGQEDIQRRRNDPIIWPPGLTELALDFEAIPTYLLASLPASLRTLRLPGLVAKYLTPLEQFHHARAQRQQISTERSSLVPGTALLDKRDWASVLGFLTKEHLPNLEMLDIGSCDVGLDASSFANLAPKLRSLDWRGKLPVEPLLDQFFAVLPRDLQKFCYHGPSLAISHPSAIALLPPRLVLLAMPSLTKPAASSKIFSFLPRCLTVLTIGAFESVITTADTQQLPQGLRVLHFHGRPGASIESGVPAALPRSLRSFSVVHSTWPCDWPSTTLADFPPRLEHLSMMFDEFPALQDCGSPLVLLPPTLRHFSGYFGKTFYSIAQVISERQKLSVANTPTNN